MFELIHDLYLFTSTCLNWNCFLKDVKYQRLITEGLSFFCKKGVCTIYGFVIMPNHIHLIISIKPEDIAYFQQSFLKYTAQSIINDMKMEMNPALNDMLSTQNDRKYQFWERRAHWRSILTTSILYQKLRYIHANPMVKRWNLCNLPENYKMSSANSYLQGISEFDFLTLA